MKQVIITQSVDVLPFSHAIYNKIWRQVYWQNFNISIVREMNLDGKLK